MTRVCLCFLLIVLVVAVAGTTASLLSSGPHIADVNILLPPKMTHPVEYLLQGSDGCFRWSWDHHDILSVLPEYNASSLCSTSARLRSIAPYSGRKETAVYATDTKTGNVIRCKVFIDNFSRIQIFHNSIKLDLEGLATLRVRAFDDQDNVFSSLVGLQFMWRLMPETHGSDHHLVHVPLKDSPLSDCGGLCGDLDIQIKLEDSGVFSDLCVVRGVGIGHEIVSVHLVEPHLKHMDDKIFLTVAEAMYLEPPSPVFILIGAALHYNLKIIRGNVPQVVTLPSPNHRWSVSNSSVARVNSTMGTAYTLNLGETTITVEDTRVSGHSQMSSLNVVLPETLYMYILPLSTTGDIPEGIGAISSIARWYVVSGNRYLVETKVFSSGPRAREIYITEEDDLELSDNQCEHWDVFLPSEVIASSRARRNSLILEATSQGLGKLTASLTYFSNHHGEKEVLKVVQEVTVCDNVKFDLEISVTSQGLLLPWAPSINQEMELKAKGGCATSSSDYKWFSSDVTVVTVSAYGVVQAKRPGTARVKVMSIVDPLNYDEVNIEVSIPPSMVMLQNFPVEIAVGSYLLAAVSMKASNDAYFSKCDAFHPLIKWKAGGESFIINNVTDDVYRFDQLQSMEPHKFVYGPPCSWTRVYASASGQATLHATFSKDLHFDYSPSGTIFLKAASRIAAYNPLSIHQAGDGSRFGGYWIDLPRAEADNQLENLNSLYLVPGSHLDVMIRGGPERWDKSVDFIESVETLDGENSVDKGVQLHHFSNNNGSLYRILCKGLGNHKLVFKRGNLVGDNHPLPTIAEISLALGCSLPSSIVLIVDEPVNEHNAIRASIQADRSPSRLHTLPVTVANGRTIRVAAVGVSHSGEAFANSSSLCLRWELSSCDSLAHWDDAYILKSLSSSWERFLVLLNESGLCTVRATVMGFCESKADHNYATLLASVEDDLTDAAQLQLVSSIKVEPEFSLLFFNPDAKENLTISGGSCFLEVIVNDSRVVDVVQSPNDLQCVQLVLSPKGLGTTYVTIYDVGLAPSSAASVLVQVADVEWIKIISGEEISLMEGSDQSISLLAGINDGITFDASQYTYLNILVYIEDDIVELAEDQDASTSAGGRHVHAPNFKIMARHVGITTLYVSAMQHSGQEILSQVIKLEVYALPTIHPADIFLVPGASYTVTMKGGPTFGVYVEYASIDDGIAVVQKSSGRLTAISPGNTTLLATIHKSGGSMICQAAGLVRVGIPSSALLHAQSEQLAIGREMPIYPLFPEGDLFSFYELCKGYKWIVEDEEVLTFRATQKLTSENSGITSFEKEFGFINLLYGRASGRTNVVVSFSCDFTSSGEHLEARAYSASMQVVVVPELPLALGVAITWLLPPHYTTSSLLPSSVESPAYKGGPSRPRIISYSMLRSIEGRTELPQHEVSVYGEKIKTTESNALACIQAKDRTTGRTEIASCVRVAEVSQIRFLRQIFYPQVVDLAVGAELEFPISYHDDLGNPFYEAYDAVHHYVETNFPDIVSINLTSSQDEIILVKALQHGRALLRVSISNNPRKSDYILVSVGAHIHPSNPVIRAGSSLNFSVIGFNGQISGHWHSSNHSIISVDVQSGEAKATGEGSTQVYFESSGEKVGTSVKVLPGGALLMDAPKEMLTNVPFPSKGYSFPLRFSDAGDKNKAFGTSKGASFNCRVDPPYVGYVKPWVDLDRGNSFCLFFPYTPEQLFHSTKVPTDIKPYVYVSVHASMEETDDISATASGLLIGGFAILNIGKDVMQLNLTPNSNKTAITVVGNTDVTIDWHNRDLLTISAISRENPGLAGHVQYEIKVLRGKSFKDKITISLPANGQREELSVSYNHEDRAVSETAITTFWASLFGSLVLLILTAVLFIRFLDRPGRVQAPPPPASAPATPMHSSPAVLKEQSPRTPSPFIDYVRRTIDETPYYRREGRRFNAQNTF